MPHQQTLSTVMAKKLLAVPSVQPLGQQLLVVLVRVNQIHQRLHVAADTHRYTHVVFR